MRRTVAFLVLVALVAAGCASSGGAEASAPAKVRVQIASFQYGPPRVRVRAGGAVTWTNHDTAPHTATARAGDRFTTRTLRRRGSRTIRFAKPGVYRYYCVFHPFMEGTVAVEQGVS